MPSRSTTPVLWTNDDIAAGKIEPFERQIRFLDRMEIPGVFFVIPGKQLDSDTALLRAIEKARNRGHEFFQHGYLHTAFECGIPELGMLEVDRKSFAKFDEKREEIEAAHTFERLCEMLENGQKVWRRAFGERSTGFRPGWGAYCTNLYRALHALDYQWVSARIPCMTSWAFAAGDWNRPVHFREAVPTKPHLVQGILEIPMAGDYAFKVPNDPQKIDRMVRLGLEEFEEYARRGDPMLIVSHFHGLEFDGVKDGIEAAAPEGTGYAIHTRLLESLKQDRRARFMNMTELLAGISAS